MARTALEEQLESITREFVRQIVGALRNASFADVAQLQVTPSAAPRPRPGRPPNRVSASPAPAQREQAGERSARREHKKGSARQTADRRAELAERLLKALEAAGQPMGVRALSSEIGVAPDLLAVPLRELRAAGRIAKHGEKRATTYALP